MKTILDAVNTLKATWPSESIQIIEIDGVEFSEKEFNAQVKECANNFGLPSVTAKPIYTQAMLDNGEWPSVGMECMVLNSYFDNAEYEKCTILFKGDFTFIYNSDSCSERVGHKDELTFKPIDSRTPKQKAVDELHAEYPYKTAGQLLSLAYDKWVK